MLDEDRGKVNGIDLMALEAIRQYDTGMMGVSKRYGAKDDVPTHETVASLANICKWTGCTQITVRAILNKLMKKGFITAHMTETGRCVRYYRLTDAAPFASEKGCTDVCGKHYCLTGTQIKELREYAERLAESNKEEVQRWLRGSAVSDSLRRSTSQVRRRTAG